MIRLFESTATSFDTLGLGNLTDATKALVVEERNGEFEIELDYPIDGVHYKDIALRCIIYCRPNPYTDEQPFRIYYISKPISGIVTIKAAHLSYDLSGIVVNPFSANSPGEALTGIKKNASTPCPFNFTTTKTGDAGFNVGVPKSARSILAGSEGSVLDIYGKGEYEFDGYDVKLHLNRGANNGVTLRYGKNIIDLNQEENCSNMYTGVYPYWKGSVAHTIHEKETDENGNTHEVEDTNYVDTLVVLPEKIVNAEGTFNFTNIYPLDLSSEFQSENQTAPTQEQVRNRAKQYMADNNIGIPKINLTVSFVVLEQAEEYEQLRLLEKVNLCDTVTIIFEKLGVNATAKCIKTVYNAITNKYESLEFGDSSTKFVDNIIDQSEAVQEVPTKGFMELAIDRATKLITGGLGGYALLHSSTGSDTPDEILILGPESKGDYKQANRIWRWNYAGLGYSNKGYNGPYELAMTIDGQINAKFVNTGQLKVGGTGAESITVYDAIGVNKLVWFDDSGMHLASGQQIEWANVKHPNNLATTTDISGLFSSVETLYFAKKVSYNSTKPEAPTAPSSKVTTDSASFGIWTKKPPAVDDTKRSGSTELFQYNCYYWMVAQYTTKGGNTTWGSVVEIDNATATTVITKNAITTSYINALNITAQDIKANRSISSPTITGGSITMKNGDTVIGTWNASGLNVKKPDGTADIMTINASGSTFKGGISGDSYFNIDVPSGAKLRFGNGAQWSRNIVLMNASSGGGLDVLYDEQSGRKSVDVHYNDVRRYNDDGVRYFAQWGDTNTSDIRLKENIKPANLNIIRDIFKRLEFVNFNFIDDDEKRNHTGVIAQQFIEILNDLGVELKEFVSVTDDHYEVMYSNICRLGLVAIQDLYAQIDDLKSQIKELREEK